jgi:hypothetical protein
MKNIEIQENDFEAQNKTMYAISTIKAKFRLSDGKITEKHHTTKGTFDLENLNIYDEENERIIEVGTQNEYNSSFTIKLNNLYILDVEPFLNHHYENSNNKNNFFKYVKYAVVNDASFISDDKKQLIKDWILEKEQKRKIKIDTSKELKFIDFINENIDNLKRVKQGKYNSESVINEEQIELMKKNDFENIFIHNNSEQILEQHHKKIIEFIEEYLMVISIVEKHKIDLIFENALKFSEWFLDKFYINHYEKNSLWNYERLIRYYSIFFDNINDFGNIEKRIFELNNHYTKLILNSFFSKAINEIKYKKWHDSNFDLTKIKKDIAYLNEKIDAVIIKHELNHVKNGKYKIEFYECNVFLRNFSKWFENEFKERDLKNENFIVNQDKTTHPFKNNEVNEIFNFIDEGFKPESKVKYSYIFDFIKEKIETSLNEKLYFKFIIKKKKLEMNLRSQPTATNEKKINLVKELYQDYLKQIEK